MAKKKSAARRMCTEKYSRRRRLFSLVKTARKRARQAEGLSHQCKQLLVADGSAPAKGSGCGETA
jgi:hypothetical protein